jgi:hypothetical protein
MTELLIGPPIVLSEIDVILGEPIIFNGVIGAAGLWTGHGVPVTVIGAAVGDEYLDVDTGDLYRLNPG